MTSKVTKATKVRKAIEGANATKAAEDLKQASPAPRVVRDADGNIIEYEVEKRSPSPSALVEAPVKPTFTSMQEIADEKRHRLHDVENEFVAAKGSAHQAQAEALSAPHQAYEAALAENQTALTDEFSRIKNAREKALKAAAAKVNGEHDAQVFAAQKRFAKVRDKLVSAHRAILEEAELLLVKEIDDADTKRWQKFEEIERWAKKAEEEFRTWEKMQLAVPVPADLDAPPEKTTP